MPRPSPVSGALAAYEHMWLLYRRTWRGSIFGNFAQPVLFLVAMGIGLGSYVNQANPASLAGRAVPPVPGPGAARVDGHAGLGVRGHVPRAGRVPLDPPLPRDVRDAARPVRDRVRPDRLDRDPRDPRRLDLRAGHPAVQRRADAGHPARDPGRDADRARVRRRGSRRSCRPSTTRTSFNAIWRFGITPLFLFSGTFFPIDQLPAQIQWVAWLLPLWHGVALARALSLGIVMDNPWLNLAHLVILLALATGGHRRDVRHVPPAAPTK